MIDMKHFGGRYRPIRVGGGRVHELLDVQRRIYLPRI